MTTSRSATVRMPATAGAARSTVWCSRSDCGAAEGIDAWSCYAADAIAPIEATHNVTEARKHVSSVRRTRTNPQGSRGFAHDGSAPRLRLTPAPESYGL